MSIPLTGPSRQLTGPSRQDSIPKITSSAEVDISIPASSTRKGKKLRCAALFLFFPFFFFLFETGSVAYAGWLAGWWVRMALNSLSFWLYFLSSGEMGVCHLVQLYVVLVTELKLCASRMSIVLTDPNLSSLLMSISKVKYATSTYLEMLATVVCPYILYQGVPGKGMCLGGTAVWKLAHLFCFLNTIAFYTGAHSQIANRRHVLNLPSLFICKIMDGNRFKDKSLAIMETFVE